MRLFFAGSLFTHVQRSPDSHFCLFLCAGEGRLRDEGGGYAVVLARYFQEQRFGPRLSVVP